MLKKTASIIALFMIFFLLACKSGPAPQPDRLEMTPTMGALEALDGASPWLPDATAGVMIVSGPQGWRELETWLFPLADAALEPGSPGTAQGLSNDLTTLVEERLGFDLFELHTLVVGAHEGGASVVAFGDVELNVDLPTVEGTAGTVYELSFSRLNQGITDTDDQGFAAFSPSLFIYPIETPRPGLIFSLSPDAFEESNFLDSPVHKGLHNIIAGVEETSPTVLLAAMSSELPELAHTGMPEPESFLFSIGDLVTMAFQGPEATLDEIDTMAAALLEELQNEFHEVYERRSSSPLSEYFASIYAFHLIEGLVAQATPERTDGILRYDVELSERGWLAAMATSGLATRLAFSNFRSPGVRYETYPEVETAAPLQGFIDSDIIPVHDSIYFGAPAAPVKIVGLLSMQCPFSARAFETLQQLVASNPGQVQVVIKHLPLQMQQQSEPAARAVEAAARQGQGIQMMELLFENLNRFRDGDFEDLAAELAGDLGLNVPQFQSNFHDSSTALRVETDQKLAQDLGIRGTPNFFVNGAVITGAQPLSRFKEALDEQKRKVDELRRDGIPEEGLYSAAVMANFQAPEQPEPEPDPEPEITIIDGDALSIDNSYTRGPDDAPITIYEFSSFQCPFCARGASTIKEILKEYPDDVRLVYKSFPLTFQQESAEAAAAAHAAGNQEKFWEMYDLLYQNQRRFTEDNIFEELARELNLDIETFHSDRQSPAVIQQVDDEAAAGSSIGVRGTPAYVINGEFHTGAQPIANFRAIIDRLLEER